MVQIPIMVAQCGIDSGICDKECAMVEIEEHTGIIYLPFWIHKYGEMVKFSFYQMIIILNYRYRRFKNSPFFVFTSYELEFLSVVFLTVRPMECSYSVNFLTVTFLCRLPFWQKHIVLPFMKNLACFKLWFLGFLCLKILHRTQIHWPQIFCLYLSLSLSLYIYL